MHRALRDRVARSTFAAGIIALHLVLAYFLISPLRKLTTAIPKSGEPMVMLDAGELREPAASVEPTEVEPQLEQPDVIWVPAAPALDIEDPADASRQRAATQAGRTEVPPSMSPEAGIAVLQRVLPRYPIESVRADEEGSAVLQVLVDESGRASDVRVARSTGFSRLDESAVSAVRLWKFAPSMQAARPVATWGELELRFDLNRFSVSRIIDAPLDLVPPGQILHAAIDSPVPGGDEALRRLIREVRTTDAEAFDAPWLRDDIKRMRSALVGWGEEGTVRFLGTAAGNRWRAYEIRPEFRKGDSRGTVELRWDVYRITHDRGASEWRIAIDRNGVIWCAQASSAHS